MAEESPLRRYTANLQGEIDSATLYRTLAETEKNPELAQVDSLLNAAEEAYAEFWKRLPARGGIVHDRRRNHLVYRSRSVVFRHAPRSSSVSPQPPSPMASAS